LVKIFEKIGRQAVDLNSFGSEWGSMVDSSEHSNELLGSVKGWEFPDHVYDYKLLKKGKSSLKLVTEYNVGANYMAKLTR
jgi:hypothetical protein